MPHASPEARAAYQRAYRERNKERLAAQKQARRAAADSNIEAAYMRAWYSKNREHVRAKGKQWREANRERARQARAEWRRANPDSHRLAQARRRAQASRGSFTLEEWRLLLEEFDHKCAYCQGQGALEVEHMTPLSRGGSHTKGNIVPACGSCNRSKNARTIFEFLGVAAGSRPWRALSQS